ncbi:Hypothetical_protein [Hexamita inflata]|uniref:Hypothetical_protein n=1 Tax=Hexamita inflata TaxID=28002 RepID=A0AA86UP27_9EUKA|nr:Hypothetical protein HINF_LOCUS50144 [Hexamita inflata]
MINFCSFISRSPQLDLYIVVVQGYECSSQQNLEQVLWRSFLNYRKYNFLKQKLELVWSRMRNTSIIIKFGEIRVSLASFGDKLKVAHFLGGLRPERGFERNILKVDEKIHEIQGYTITNTSPFFLRNLQKCQQTTSNHFSVMSNKQKESERECLLSISYCIYISHMMVMNFQLFSCFQLLLPSKYLYLAFNYPLNQFLVFHIWGGKIGQNVKMKWFYQQMYTNSLQFHTVKSHKYTRYQVSQIELEKMNSLFVISCGFQIF